MRIFHHLMTFAATCLLLATATTAAAQSVTLKARYAKGSKMAYTNTIKVNSSVPMAGKSINMSQQQLMLIDVDDATSESSRLALSYFTQKSDADDAGLMSESPVANVALLDSARAIVTTDASGRPVRIVNQQELSAHVSKTILDGIDRLYKRVPALEKQMPKLKVVLAANDKLTEDNLLKIINHYAQFSLLGKTLTEGSSVDEEIDGVKFKTTYTKVATTADHIDVMTKSESKMTDDEMRDFLIKEMKGNGMGEEMVSQIENHWDMIRRVIGDITLTIEGIYRFDSNCILVSATVETEMKTAAMTQNVSSTFLRTDYPSSALRVDSIGRAPSDEHCAVELSVDYPVGGPQTLVDSLRTFISKELQAWVGNIWYTEDKPVNANAAYTGDLDDGHALVSHFAEFYLNDLQKYRADMERDGMLVDEIKTMPSLFNLTMKKAAEEPKFVTYDVDTYSIVAGAAHGASSQASYTFRTDNGQAVTQVVDTTATLALQPLLREGLGQYLGRNLEKAPTEKEIDDFIASLFIDNGIIPLPAAEPSMMTDGVSFKYGSYEIGPYAIGMPSFVIPYSKIKPYMTSEAQELIP